MAMHRKPKPAYLPRVAAGAAPLALLFAGPATAWAGETAQLPLDHQHTGSFDKGLKSGNALGDKDHSGFLDGFITTTNQDVFSGTLGDVELARNLSSTAQQFGRGVFSGTLDVARQADGAVGAGAGAGDKVDTAIGQSRNLGGRIGPVSGWGSVSQGTKLGHQGKFAGTLLPDGTPEGTVTQYVDATLTGATSGELNVEHVLDVQGGTETRLGASGDLTKQDGSFTQKDDLKVRLFDQAPLRGGLTISAPPLAIEPRW